MRRQPLQPAARRSQQMMLQQPSAGADAVAEHRGKQQPAKVVARPRGRGPGHLGEQAIGHANTQMLSFVRLRNLDLQLVTK